MPQTERAKVDVQFDDKQLAELKVIKDKTTSSILTFSDEVKVKVVVEAMVPGDWIAMCTLWNDLFGNGYIGYWARGIRRDDTKGWLVWEYEDDDRLSDFLDEKECRFIEQLGEAEDDLHAEAYKAWEENKPLPPRYHRLDREAAVRAFALMVSSGREGGGVEWYENGDANSYDVAVQLSLFSEIKYG